MHCKRILPQTTLQTCIVHLIRNSLDYASWKDRKGLATALKPIYTAPSAEAAIVAELDALKPGHGGRNFRWSLPHGAEHGTRSFHSFAFPPEIRRVIYTINAIESVFSRLRKIIKTRSHFPSDDAATKLIWAYVTQYYG